MDETSHHESVHPVSTAESGEHAHEATDVSIRGLAVFGVILAVTAGLLHILLWNVYDYFESARRKPDVPITARPGGREVVEFPRLQPDPHADLVQMRAAESAVLDGYGWVDREQGITRIPIDKAMDLVAERGLNRPRPEATKGEK